MFTTYYLSASGKALMVISRKVGEMHVQRGNVHYKRFSIARATKVVPNKALCISYDAKGEMVIN